LLCAVSSGHLLWLEFGFWFWIVCSKAASSGINVTQGSITRNDSKFIQIQYIERIHFGMGRTEEHLHVDTTNHLGKQTWRRSRTPRLPDGHPGSRDNKALHGDPSIPTPQTANPEKRGHQAPRSHVQRQHLTTTTPASASQRPPRANR